MSAVSIYPTVEELSVVKNCLKCPENGCCGTFKSPSNLDMHLVKHHNIKPVGRVRANLANFFCPSKLCKYNKLPFPKFKLLKQHYLKCHAEKKFKCDLCEKSFATEAMQLAHRKTCGTSYSCECGWYYQTKSALALHCKRKNHNPGNEINKNPDTMVVCKTEIEETVDYFISTTHYVAAVALSELSSKLTIPKLNHKGVQTGDCRTFKKTRKHKATQETQTGGYRKVMKLNKINTETQTNSPYEKKKKETEGWKKSTETQTIDLTLLIDGLGNGDTMTGDNQLSYDGLFSESSNSNSSPSIQKTDAIWGQTSSSTPFHLNPDICNDTPLNRLCSIETQTDIGSLLNTSACEEFSTTETQTTDNFEDLHHIYNNTCTQTNDEVSDLFNFEFVDIETQTAWPVL